jgi:hypothetical protein
MSRSLHPGSCYRHYEYIEAMYSAVMWKDPFGHGLLPTRILSLTRIPRQNGDSNAYGLESAYRFVHAPFGNFGADRRIVWFGSLRDRRR